MAKTAKRRHNEYVKGMRRIKEDRAEHGADRWCHCFDKQADKGRGYTFKRFANTPKICSNPTCCGNPRRGGWGKKKIVTIQEEKAPKIEDWK